MNPPEKKLEKWASVQCDTIQGQKPYNLQLIFLEKRWLHKLFWNLLTFCLCLCVSCVKSKKGHSHGVECRAGIQTSMNREVSSFSLTEKYWCDLWCRYVCYDLNFIRIEKILNISKLLLKILSLVVFDSNCFVSMIKKLKYIHFRNSVLHFMKTRSFSWCQVGLAWKGLVKDLVFIKWRLRNTF